MEFIYKTYFSDATFWKFWAAGQKGGRLDAFFFDRPPLDQNEFAAWVRRPDNHVWLARHEGKVFGMAALNGVKGKTAYAHFLFLSGAHPLRIQSKPFLVEAMRRSLKMLLGFNDPNGGPMFERVLGCTPETSPTAYKVLLHAGGRQVGRIPGACYLWRENRNVDGIVTETKLSYLD